MHDVADTRVPWTTQTRTFASRHVRQVLRNRMILVLAVAWPVLWYFLTLAFFVEAPSGQAGGVKAGMAITYGLLGAFTITVAVFAGDFARDLDGERYRKFRAMPISPTADLAGRLLAGMVFGVGSYAATLLVSIVHGAEFGRPSIGAIGVIALTLVLFCFVAMSFATVLALVVTKPEHMTTIAVIGVLIAFYATGFNGVSPQLLADGADMINYLPNSLATRMQIAALSSDVSYMTPPEAPDSIEFVGLLAGYAAVLLATAVLILRRFAYAPE
ncbi:ABC-2 type transport system permease protein [Natronoarchaeum philippinense]|uniref:ABC-2 type transport system permease protein n=1 Tax=Natronoarchaeum philippinense TaxID=558529 RepID=A0A285NUV6_NATPI|nr:ABC transporter permease [Natronoarchaeum philippinense]SNZ12703.1 ABC-2 type transport system permease protein [Natronoarchaeum philippinense]